MENKVNVDPCHICEDKNYEKIEIEDRSYCIAKRVDKNDEDHYYFLFQKKGVNLESKCTFINHCEKSYELIHPSVANLSKYSTDGTHLYYKYYKTSDKIENIELKDTTIQIIFLGIASGLSYLLSKGYYYRNFSIKSIIFTESYFPRLIDYINFDYSKKLYENDLIPIYADILTFFINKKKEEDSSFSINEEFKNLIERSKQGKNIPSFQDYIQFFQTKNYCKDTNVVKELDFKISLEIFQYIDKIPYDETSSSNKITILSDIVQFDSVEQICLYFYKNRKKMTNEMYLKHRYFLNYLPEYYIKAMATFFGPISEKLQKYLYYEDLSMIFPEWTKLFQMYNDKNPFKIYKELMKQIKQIDTQINEVMHLYKKRKILECQVDALRIQAIYFLKKAYKTTNNAKIKIELAVQYLNGSILPYNLNKSLKILEKIKNADKDTKTFIQQMKRKIQTTIETTSIDKILKTTLKNKKEQTEILTKAERGDILSMLYCGFAFYTGFNNFPILRSLSIQYYRAASKKSPHAMTLLGKLYLKGVIFPQNFNRAKNCFKRAAIDGDLRAEILDCLLRKHLWRSYYIDVDVDDILNHYLPTFDSMMPGDLYAILHSIYKMNDIICKTELVKENNMLHSEKNYENYSMKIHLKRDRRLYSLIDTNFSNKIQLNFDKDEKAQKVKKAKEEMSIAMSYFYGDNGYPVNYSEAAHYFQLAADKGDSDAQWRYAMMCLNNLEVNDKQIKHYLQQSAKLNNLRGKILYALYLKADNKTDAFEQYIQECCDSINIDAMYYNALYLENDESSQDLQKLKLNYQKAADAGHFDSLIRLIYFLKHYEHYENYEKKHEYYSNFSVAIFNESLLIKRIIYYDKKKQFDQSNIIIQIGLKLNYRLFNAFYARHLLYGRGMDIDEKRAEKFVFLAHNDNYPAEYWERYIYIMLEILMRRGQHLEAAKFLLKNKSNLTMRFRTLFLKFFKKIDKVIAKEHFITVNFVNKEYQDCIPFLQDLDCNVNILKAMNDLRELAINEGNPYAMAILGKIYKQGKYALRDLKKAIKFFALSAQKKCPEGYYFFGKEFYYGRFLNQDYELAEKYLRLAMYNNGDPRAGYYLYEIRDFCQEKNDLPGLLKISAELGYRRALYKYGHRLITGKDHFQIDEIKGYKLIEQAASLNYRKAKRFVKLNRSYYKANRKESTNLINEFEVNNKYKINVQFSLDEDDIFSDIDSESEDENINKFIRGIKNKKNQNNSDEKETKHEQFNEREQLLNILNDLTNKNHSDNNNNNDDEMLSNTKNSLSGDKKKSHKISSSEKYESSELDKDEDEIIKKISSSLSINANDDDNSYSLNRRKRAKKKSHTATFSNSEFEDNKSLNLSSISKDKKSSKLNIDKKDKKPKSSLTVEDDYDDDDDISDMLNFWV